VTPCRRHGKSQPSISTFCFHAEGHGCRDFSRILAELLPGNFADLQPQEGQDVTQGLEVEVQLGTVWKQNLTELSGGQRSVPILVLAVQFLRSLITLSLIMAPLQFKPAPTYTLDELNTTPDLSHTQHVGQLIRTRFKGSQFIVVSQKLGLFTNANVLFSCATPGRDISG
jgi:structural maintenance of chromosome 2